MPVVSATELNPARLFPARIGWGFVRDGETLRICRIGSGRALNFYNLTLEAWRGGEEPTKRFKKDWSRGARVAVGLEPHRVLLRELVSPFADIRKSAEIWPSLLDAQIPFSLEECRVAFLQPRRDARAGLRCLAIAARDADLKEALHEWTALGIEADLLVPETLLLEGQGAVVWQGHTRSVFVARDDSGWLGAGGSLDSATRETTLARFVAAWNAGVPSRVGPGTEPPTQPQSLERSLASACVRPSPVVANLRSGELASPRMSERLYRARRTLRVAAILVAVLLITGPLLLLHRIREARSASLRASSELFRQLTGRSSPAPGQERLLAQRYVEQEWMPVRETAAALARPAQTRRLAMLLSSAAVQGLELRSLRLEGNQFAVQALGGEGSMRAFCDRLGVNGWKLNALKKESETAWSVDGEVAP